MSYDIITIGDAMRDIFIFPELEEMEKPKTERQVHAKESFDKYLVFGLGDKITIADVEFTIGGTAANVAAGLAKIGLKTAIISAVGSDNAGTDVKEKLIDRKVSTNLIKTYQNKKTSFKKKSLKKSSTLALQKTHNIILSVFKLEQLLTKFQTTLLIIVRNHTLLH